MRLGAEVVDVGDGAVTLAGGARLVADQVVVATDSPVGGADLLLSAEHGPVNNLAVMSDVAPGYAPEGGACIAVSLLGVPTEDDETLDAAVRDQLAAWFGAAVRGWQRLAVHRIAYAQPRQDVSDLDVLARDQRVGERTWVCGDHLDTGSIQGALVSGRRVADQVHGALSAELP